MKKIALYFFVLFALISKVHAQNQQNWIQYNDGIVNSTFLLPASAIIATEDSSKMKIYATEVDSLLGLQVHVIDSAYLDSNDSLIVNALALNNNDTLRAMVQLLLLATNSTLTNIDDIYLDGKNGLEIGIEYNELASDIQTLTFMQFFLLGDKLVFYTISGSTDDMTRLMSYKNTFFSSVNFY